MSVPDEYKDPDLRDLDEEQRPAATVAPSVLALAETLRPATYATVHNGKFNDGWVEILRLLNDTLTDEQHALLQQRFKELKKGGTSVR